MNLGSYFVKFSGTYTKGCSLQSCKLKTVIFDEEHKTISTTDFVIKEAFNKKSPRNPTFL